MTVDQFMVRMRLTESDAYAFAAAHCDLVYNAIDFDGKVNDVIKF